MFNPFSNTDDDTEPEDSDENIHTERMRNRLQEEMEPTVTTTETRSADYTEHKATLTYTDGETREFTFDSMNHGENGLTFKNYTGAYEKQKAMIGRVQRFQSEAFLYVPYGSLRDLETTERADRSIEYEVEVEKPASEVDGE